MGRGAELPELGLREEGSGWSLNTRPVLVVVFGVGLFVPPEHMMESIRSLRRK